MGFLPLLEVRTGTAVLCAAAAALVFAGCGQARPQAGGQSAGADATSAGATNAGSTGAAPAAGASDAHAKHLSLGFNCLTCHCGGGAFGFSALVLPGGTSIAGGQIVRGSPTTCSVACHYPFGAPAQWVAWNAGPLACTSCHGQVAAPRRSSHFAHIADASGACQTCHDQSGHTSGRVGMVGSLDGSNPDALCTGCHSGSGQTLGQQAPPLLLGWNDAVNGDFHGARQGTGYGGTLQAPYVRGQPALPCLTCHDTHSSVNAFLLASTVNGTPIAAGTIDRAGVGAEVLCNACHQGDRHGACKACHTDTKIPDSEGWGYDPSGNPVDPEPPGSACFWCHGHEGILRWTAPGSADNMYNRPPDPGCVHCHSLRQPPTEYAPPVIASNRMSTNWPQGGLPQPQVWLTPNGSVFGITATTATVYWETDESATSYVEYGVGTAGVVAGTNDMSCGIPCPGRFHQVTLTGLTPNTPYIYRLRSSDQFRNVTESPLSTFTTASADGPVAPILVHQGDVWSDFNDSGIASADVVLQWNAVTDPDGDPVQYRVVLATDPSFATSISDSGWIDASSFPVSVTTRICTPFVYYWRVMAKDAVHDRPSPWSPVDSFLGGMKDIYESCPW